MMSKILLTRVWICGGLLLFSFVTLGKSVAADTSALLYRHVIHSVDDKFETRLTLSNTSRDLFGTTEASGTCRLQFVGVDAPDPDTITTKLEVNAGQTVAWPLAAGDPIFGIPAALNFEGYIIADCQFPFAQGTGMIRKFEALSDGQDFRANVEVDTLTLCSDSKKGKQEPDCRGQ